MGNDTKAEEILTNFVALDSKDVEAQKILECIRSKKAVQAQQLAQVKSVAPHPCVKTVLPPPDQSPLLVDVQKDGAIIDANFLIKVHNYDPPHFHRFIKKTRRRFNLYTSHNVYFEMNSIGLGLPLYAEVQQLILESIIRMEIPSQTIKSLEHQIPSQYRAGKSIKQSHKDRPKAWINDLSLICLLMEIKNPIKYIVTNDWGVQKIVQSLYPEKEKSYYFHSLIDFLSSVNLLCGTNQKSIWEQTLYKGA